MKSPASPRENVLSLSLQIRSEVPLAPECVDSLQSLDLVVAAIVVDFTSPYVTLLLRRSELLRYSLMVHLVTRSRQVSVRELVSEWYLGSLGCVGRFCVVISLGMIAVIITDQLMLGS